MRREGQLRLLTQFAGPTALVASGGFVGGVGTALFLTGACVLASAIPGSSAGGSRLLHGIVLQLLGVALFWMLVGPMASLGGLSALLFDELQLNGAFSALPFEQGSRSVSRVGGILALLLAPLTLVPASMIKRRRDESPILWRDLLGAMSLPAFVGALSLLPFAIIKYFRPENLLAATMSGDARNHFLIVQQARATTMMANFLSPSDLASPRFPHSIAAVISAANGTEGVNQPGDQWALVGLLAVSFAVLSIAGAVAVAAAAARARLAPRAAFAVSCGAAPALALIPAVPYVLFPNLADGFVTLVVGSSALAALGAIHMSAAGVGRSWVAVLRLLPAVYVLVLSYPFLVVPGLLIVCLPAIPIALQMWRRSRLSTVSAGVLVLLVAAYSARWLYPTFASSATLFGAALPRNIGVVVLVLLFSSALLLLRPDETAAVVAALSVGTITTVALIERVPGNELAGYSYYSTKVIIGGVAALMVLMPAMLITAVLPLANSLLARRTTSRALAQLTAGVLLTSLIPLGIARAVDSTPLVQRIVWTGWSTPTPVSVVAAMSSWGSEPTAFFRYTPGEDGWVTPEDRLMNFWMPAFWSGFDGPYTPLWTWVYFTHASSETPVACEVIQGGITKIITRDSGLRLNIQTECPDLGNLVSIEVRA